MPGPGPRGRRRGRGGSLPAACAPVRSGGVVHFYTIAERARIEAVKDEAADLVRHGGKEAQILATRVVRGYSPGKVHLAMDLRII